MTNFSTKWSRFSRGRIRPSWKRNGKSITTSSTLCNCKIRRGTIERKSETSSRKSHTKKESVKSPRKINDSTKNYSTPRLSWSPDQKWVTQRSTGRSPQGILIGQEWEFLYLIWVQKGFHLTKNHSKNTITLHFRLFRSEASRIDCLLHVGLMIS